MNRIIETFIFALVLTLFIGCASKTAAVHSASENDDEAIEQAEQLYREGKYRKALKIVEPLRYSASVQADNAHIITAKIYIEQKEYEMAASELKWLLGQYPNSDCREEAAFLVGEAYRKASPRAELDQDYTNRAIEAYNDFIDRFPTSEFIGKVEDGIALCKEKLAQKQYLSARLYFRLGQDSSAVIYINDIRERYPDTSWKLWADYLEARICINKDDFAAAKSLLESLLDSEPDDKLRKKAQKSLKKCKM